MMSRAIIIFYLLLIQIACLNAQILNKTDQSRSAQEESVKKFDRTIDLINRYYVDTVDNHKIVEQAIIGMLRQLDPHSNYLTAEQIKRANEDLEGSFGGIGVEFQMLDDTAVIMTVVTGGPAEKYGLQQGDKILKIDGENSTGSGINNAWISRRVRGEKETELLLTVLREGLSEPLQVSVMRDQIPTYSVDSYFMVTEETGYIKVSRFMRTTVPEFEEALKSLRKDGLENLILDLRGNTGGYLRSAVQLADHFLGRGKIIVYTEGVNAARVDYTTTGKGQFKKGKLVVLIDERSASASEIVTGAIQDWDRGLVIGNRSFGKGLVQKPYNLPDGSAIRLTIARYYTPVGRCIQRPYEQGRDRYYEELNERIRAGVYLSVDSMNLNDSLKYLTPNGRIVYGGGGIMPDIIMGADTTGRSDYLTTLHRRNIFNRFAIQTIRTNKDSILQLYPDAESFYSDVQLAVGLLYRFSDFAANAGIEGSEEEHRISDPVITRSILATLSRLLYGNSDALKFQHKSDIFVLKAVEAIEDAESERNFRLSQE